MIIRGSELETTNGRKDYGIGRHQDKIPHFVERVTTPDNSFQPHKHDGLEFWYIVEGEAIVSLDGQESVARPGDLVILKPWIEHGLRTESKTRWLCFG